MKVHHCKHSKRRAFASIAMLNIIVLIFLIIASCSKEEKAEKQHDMENKTVTDTSKTLPSAIEGKGNITIMISNEGEVFIQDKKTDLDSISIQSRIDDLKNKFPDGEIIIYKYRDSPSRIVTEVSDLVSADKIIDVVVHGTKE